MRKLTENERAEVSCRRAGFDRFLEERMPVLKDFMDRLELPNPAMVLVEAERYLAPLDQWIKDQVVSPDDRIWILTRLGYFIGEFLVQRLGGHWFLNDIPDSRFFGRYVVGRFHRITNSNAMVDPFQVAEAFLHELPGRSLSHILAQVESELGQNHQKPSGPA
jgi:hypothetical protein